MKTLLQRKCDGGGGCCSDCDKKKLQRDAIGPAPQRVPPIVHDVLRSSGEPLDRGTRVAMESRFDHDFSRVRLHRDDRAAESAAAVGARGYTVGANVVLGRNADRDTLAHELAHTIQQEGATYGGELEIGRADDPLEHDADGMARGRSPLALRREPPKTEPPKQEPPKTEPPKKAPPEQHAGQRLTDDETKKAGDLVGGAKLTVDEQTIAREKDSGPGAATTFILHDTSSSVSAAGIKAQVDQNRGPLGKGVNAFVPRDDPATITRPFFETFRPTTTDAEKNLDFFRKPGDTATGGALATLLKSRRDVAFRKVWSLVDPVFYPQIFPPFLTDMNLTPAEIKEEVEGKGKGTKHEPGAMEQLSNPKVANIFTSATWGVELVVVLARSDLFAKILAVKGKDADLKTAAVDLFPYFTGRDAIISSTVTAEIVQPGVTKAGGDAGFVNSCMPNDARVAPFRKPSYSDNQYNNVRALYLRAALAAKSYPFITTHKVVDEKYGGHCDPRCFNIGRLYDDIATTVGHNVGPSRYGVEPTYGNKPGTSVWWDNFSKASHVCAEAQPK
jgi:hypothetical protein